jgi:hypothetical protein
VKTMGIEQRLTRLEGVVERLATTSAGFIKSATEFHNEATRMLNAHDQWLRGQGPTNGRERRNPRG